MLNSLHRMRENAQERKERGMSTIIYILLIGLICGVLGVGMDGAMGTYTANGLKNALDNSAVAASQQTIYSGKNRAINPGAAKTRFNAIYGEYRKAYPNVTKEGNYKLTEFRVYKSRGGKANNTLTVTVTNKSRTRFIGMLGINTFNYKQSTTARLGSLYETI